MDRLVEVVVGEDGLGVGEDRGMVAVGGNGEADGDGCLISLCIAWRLFSATEGRVVL